MTQRSSEQSARFVAYSRRTRIPLQPKRVPFKQPRRLASCFVDCISGVRQTTESFVTEHFSKGLPAECTICNGDITQELAYEETPDLLVMAFSSFGVGISASVSMKHITRNRILHLRGVVYFVDFHLQRGSYIRMGV